MNALLSHDTLAELAANDNGDDRRRLEARFGYGFAALGDRFTSLPEIALGLSNVLPDPVRVDEIGVLESRLEDRRAAAPKIAFQGLDRRHEFAVVNAGFGQDNPPMRHASDGWPQSQANWDRLHRRTESITRPVRHSQARDI